MLGGQHVLDAAVAVARGGVHARGIGDGRFLQHLRVNAGDLAGLLRGVVGEEVDVVLPHRAHVHLGAVLERHLAAALFRVQRRPETVREGHVVQHEALGLTRGVQAGLIRLATFRGRLPVLPFPAGVGSRGVVPGQLAVLLVDDHEAAVGAALFQVGFLQNARDDVRRLLGGARGRGLEALLLHHQHGSVHPLAHVQIVVQLVLDDDLGPAVGHGAVGAGSQVHPDVRLLAEVRLARVHDDVLVGAGGHVHRGTAAVVVVGELGSAAPLHEHARAAHHFHPAVGVGGVDGRGVEARPLANLVGLNAVGAAEQLLEGAVGGHGPNTRRAAHKDAGFLAVLVLVGMDGVHRGLVGLVPADALPLGVFALRGGALQRIAEPVGVVGRLQ